MLSLIIALVAGVAVRFGTVHFLPDEAGWALAAGIGTFLLLWIVSNVVVNKKLMKVFTDVQNKIIAQQDRLRREANMYMQKGMASAALQKSLEEKTVATIREAIAMIDSTQPLRKWNLLVGRQADTMKAQLLYQIKDYAAADPLLKRALAFDPVLLCMKMARAYRAKDEKAVKKLYGQGTRRFKGEKSVLVYALYSWILVKESKLDEAIAVLDQGKTRTDNAVLKQNWENLVNNRVKRFSNAGLGDTWYALNLEEPKIQRVRQQPGYF